MKKCLNCQNSMEEDQEVCPICKVDQNSVGRSGYQGNLTATQYLNLVLKGYITSDIRHMLDIEEFPAGPILVTTMNGIDIAGGILYGFNKNNSHCRSKNFMLNNMGFCPEVAEFMYSCIRCGMDHEGCTYKGVIFGRAKKKHESRDKIFFWAEQPSRIGINVDALASKFLEDIIKIKEGKYHPFEDKAKTNYKDKDRKSFENKGKDKVDKFNNGHRKIKELYQSHTFVEFEKLLGI